MKRFLIALIITLSVFSSSANVVTQEVAKPTIEVVEYSKTFIGTPYVWGATGPKCFDCSGFVGYVYKHFDIILPRCSWEMAELGKKVTVEESQPGDLIFFKNPRKAHPVGHVGMVINNYDDGTIDFIHCSCSKGVTIQRFPDNGYYSRRFVQIRRI